MRLRKHKQNLSNKTFQVYKIIGNCAHVHADTECALHFSVCPGRAEGQRWEREDRNRGGGACWRVSEAFSRQHSSLTYYASLLTAAMVARACGRLRSPRLLIQCAILSLWFIFLASPCLQLRQPPPNVFHQSRLVLTLQELGSPTHCCALPVRPNARSSSRCFLATTS